MFISRTIRLPTSPSIAGAASKCKLLCVRLLRLTRTIFRRYLLPPFMSEALLQSLLSPQSSPITVKQERLLQLIGWHPPSVRKKEQKHQNVKTILSSMSSNESFPVKSGEVYPFLMKHTPINRSEKKRAENWFPS